MQVLYAVLEYESMTISELYYTFHLKSILLHCVLLHVVPV